MLDLFITLSFFICFRAYTDLAVIILVRNLGISENTFLEITIWVFGNEKRS
jgi:hypothetical protein